MAEEIAFKITTDTEQGEKSVKSIKQQLKEANIELIKAQENFGDYSAEALAAARSVAKLKDQVQEAKETADLFDPGKKFAAFSGVLQTTAAGYAGLQGAIGLFGTESAELEKQLLKVQSALALSEGLSAVKDGAKDFNRLGAIIKTQVVTAFSTLKGAIIATGIGALAIAVGLVIANFETVKKVVLDFIPGLAKVGEFIGKLVDNITDLVGATSEASRAYDSLAKTNKNANEEINRRIKLLQAQGGKEAEIAVLSKNLAENELNNLRAKLKSEGKLNEEDLKQFRNLKNEKAVIDAQETARLKTEGEKRIADRKALREKEAAVIKKEEEDRLLILGIARVKEFEAQKADQALKDLAAKNLVAKQKTIDDNFLNRALNVKLSDVLINNQAEQKKLQDLASAAAEQDKLDALVYENKKQRLNATVTMLSNIGQLLGQQTAAGKALAIATATINTYQGATEALKEKSVLPAPFSTIARFASAAAIIANGLKTIKQIAGVRVPGGGGGGGSIPTSNSFSSASISGGVMAAPIQSGVNVQQTSAVGTTNVNLQNQTVIKAYVVESDITDSQDRINKIKAAATI